ncbi:hypothetical protein, variant 1 [Aphanomyces invadans]|uniref:Membrane transporter protein n=2 Tax=Aphanomyces invadans TaxID=157072 RepID=A0A024UBZ0_9STRA|nr:hypothetical protein, variant 1 [Aphanomyces invadans]ETW03730.1 hypothetical protein, variant 1 [Aphanomyces invadans]|eukprot:XP_008867959.1 hypothetical protein, variant 1 [Aphanomyces invadans]
MRAEVLLVLGTAGVAASAGVKHPAVGLQCLQRQDCGFLPGLACINQTCAHCTTNADCGMFPTDLSKRCIVLPTTRSTVCIEKNLFDPFTAADVFATCMAFLSAALGSGCGVGGGGLLVPLYILVVGLSPKHAIPLSKATIFGGAAATFFVNFRKPHPLRPKRPLIDYALAAMMEPPTLVGSIFGVMFNRIFPSWLILILLITLLSYTSYRTLQKGYKVFGKEQLALHTATAPPADESTSCLIHIDKVKRKVEWCARKWLLVTRESRQRRVQRRDDEADFKSLPPLVLPPNKEEFFAKTRAALATDECTTFPMQNVLPLFACWCVVVAQAIVLGGHGAPSLLGIPCGTMAYWLLTFVPLAILLRIMAWMGQRLRLRNRLRVLSKAVFVDGDVHWTRAKTHVVFPLYCVVAGIAAGLLGIGGGMVKGPVMLENGILPPVQSSTASFMILFTSSATTLLFSIAGMFPGQLQYDYVLWFATVGCCGGLFGQKVVGYLLKKYHRTSILVFILAFTIGLSAVCMGYVGAQTAFRDFAKGVDLGFSSVCAAP